MENIVDILSDYITYYNAVRQVGHTSITLIGAKSNPDSIVLVNTPSMAQYFEERGVRTLSCMRTEQLRGRYQPILFDNHALLGVFSTAHSELTKLQLKIELMSDKNRMLAKNNKTLELELQESQENEVYFRRKLIESEKKLEDIKKLINNG